MPKDLQQRVMDRVVSYERHRTRRWWWLFWMSLTLLGAGLVTIVITIVLELREEGTLSIVDIVREDGVTLSQAWRDIIGVIWEDLTHAKIYAFVLVIALIVSLIVVTSRRRRILHRSKQELQQLPPHQPKSSS